jgi:hypothetical protein
MHMPPILGNREQSERADTGFVGFALQKSIEMLMAPVP